MGLGKRCTYSGKSKKEKRDLRTSDGALRKVRCVECRIEREERFREAGPAFSVPDVPPPAAGRLRHPDPPYNFVYEDHFPL